MEFTDDPFKDYRYEDPFNIEDPFADVTDSRNARPTSVSDDLFSSAAGIPREKLSGRVSAPPVSDPFRKLPSNNNATAAWPNDDWASEDAWAKPAAAPAAWPDPDEWKTDNWANKTDAWTDKNDKNDWANKTDTWATKTDNWAADWGADNNKNLNDTWPSNTLPHKKEKSPKPVKYAKSLVHTIGGIGRTKQKKKEKAQLEARSSEALPTEEQQLAWAAAESKRLEKEAEKRRMQEDAELQLALAISRQEK